MQNWQIGRLGALENLPVQHAGLTKHVDNVGLLYWRYPDGRTASLVTTEPWSLTDWLSAIGLGLTALGVMLATAGLATPAVLTGLGVATAAFGVASTLADVQHRSELGILTDADIHGAILFIAADIVSALTLGIGRAAALAGEAAATAGRTTQMVVRLRQAAALATAADKALGVTVLVTMGADYLQQYQAIVEANLPPTERDAALKELTTSALFTGALILDRVISGAMETLDRPDLQPGTPLQNRARPPRQWGPMPSSSAARRRANGFPAPDAARELHAAEAVGRHQDLPSDPAYRHQVEIDQHTPGRNSAMGRAGVDSRPSSATRRPSCTSGSAAPASARARALRLKSPPCVGS